MIGLVHVENSIAEHLGSQLSVKLIIGYNIKSTNKTAGTKKISLVCGGGLKQRW